MTKIEVRRYLAEILPQLADLADTIDDAALSSIAFKLRLLAPLAEPSLDEPLQFPATVAGRSS
jgi:hypothetical protein